MREQGVSEEDIRRAVNDSGLFEADDRVAARMDALLQELGSGALLEELDEQARVLINRIDDIIGEGDPLTRQDRSALAVILASIARRFPGWAVVVRLLLQAQRLLSIARSVLQFARDVETLRGDIAVLTNDTTRAANGSKT